MMGDKFIVDLPPEANDKRFNVYAPDGGLAEPIAALREKRSKDKFLDLDVRHGSIHGILRIYPEDNLSPDRHNPNKYYVSDGVACFLDKNGEEHGGNLCFGGYLETVATHAGSITGELTLWRRSLPEFFAAS